MAHAQALAGSQSPVMLFEHNSLQMISGIDFHVVFDFIIGAEVIYLAQLGSLEQPQLLSQPCYQPITY